VAVANFIPQVWAAKLLINLRKFLVYAQDGVVNRDYEGEIAGLGDTVNITAIGAITVSDYTKDTDMNAPQALTDAQVKLLINRAKYFNFAIDDVDKAQANPGLMAAAMDEASYALRDEADQYVAGLYTGVASANTIGSDASAKNPTSNTAGTSAYEYLVDLGVLLDNAKVPQEGRWVVVPPWYYGLLLKDDRFVKVGQDIAGQVLRNGQVGEAASFRVLRSHNVPNTGGALYKIIAGHQERHHVCRPGHQDGSVPPRAALCRRGEGPAPVWRQAGAP
jgi:hypothetical protein